MARYYDRNSGLVAETNSLGKVARIDKFNPALGFSPSRTTVATIFITVDGAPLPISPDCHASDNGPTPGA